ncbi:NAD(P)/FAD-dependent oxidoreductase [Pseudomonas poae]|uniref:FAD-dependent oxidoreductase n=1 Tax=Pseudomonas poae TaxID=200451 RepID=A0A2S9EC31_9PSED|nr:NAD(P)/FAD-dependent oxidoreductase [Pseudomonas poae]PRA23238.1 FAD-dependent oxidoreductase [Pseudomonas poae]PRC12489.1 FAD-dependent oxidoreductase [Pseudomonas poae]
MNRFDVIVVGAGPAGCATAIYGAQRGLRIALLETSRFPRHRPGETLHPGVEPLLQQLGVAALTNSQDCLRHAGHWVHWDGPPRFQSFGKDGWRGFQINRATLDEHLLKAANHAGVEVFHPRRLHQVLFEHRRAQGVLADATPWKAHYVVDATGRNGWMQRQLGTPWLRFSPKLIARYGYCRDERLVHEELGLFAHAQGWHWIARINSSCLHWTQLYFVEGTQHAPCPRELDHLAAIGPIRGADVSWRCCHTTAGPGYFLVGDAAATLDPCASHGVIKALISGMQAASAIIDCLSGRADEATVQAAYQAWVLKTFERDVVALRDFYHIHPYPPHWL